MNEKTFMTIYTRDYPRPSNNTWPEGLVLGGFAQLEPTIFTKPTITVHGHGCLWVYTLYTV